MRYYDRGWRDEPRNHSPASDAWVTVLITVLIVIALFIAADRWEDLGPVPSTPVEVLD